MNRYQELIELNNNSNLKYKIGEGNSNILKEKNETFERINNYMSLDFYIPSLKESKQVIKFYGFPTDEDNICLASYYTTLAEEDVFGIKVGTTLANAEEILVSHGYSKNGNNFSNGVVHIKFNILSTEKNVINNIEISLKSKYLGNRLY